MTNVIAPDTDTTLKSTIPLCFSLIVKPVIIRTVLWDTVRALPLLFKLLTATCAKICTRGWNHFFLLVPTNSSSTVNKMTKKRTWQLLPNVTVCFPSSSPSEHPYRDHMGETIQHTWDSQDVPPTQELPASRYRISISLHLNSITSTCSKFELPGAVNSPKIPQWHKAPAHAHQTHIQTLPVTNFICSLNSRTEASSVFLLALL